MNGNITMREATQVIEDAMRSSGAPKSRWSINRGMLSVVLDERIVEIGIPRNQTFYALQNLREEVMLITEELRKERDAKQIDLEQYIKQTPQERRAG